MRLPSYFLDHITESISINSERRPFYKKLSGGKSEAGFRLLIALEILMVPSTWFWDKRCAYYQRNGVPLLKDELVSMNRTPDFDPEKKVQPGPFPKIPWKSFQKKLSVAIRTEDPSEIVRVARDIILEMSAYPHYYPMTRHLVESIYRFAWFMPVREKEARARGLKNPRSLILSIIRYHLVGFWFFMKIDEASAPVQAQGIPMLTSELPDLMHDLEGVESL